MANKIQHLEALAKSIRELHSNEDFLRRVEMENPWFIPQFTKTALINICDQYLDKTKLENWLSSVLTAISAGNTIIVSVENSEYLAATQVMEEALNNIKMKNAVFHVCPIGELEALIQHPRLAGAILDPSSDWQSYFSRQLAKRDGAILPLISEYDIERLYYRMVTEKTISIDTTAAGGNTSLMTMAVKDIEDPFVFI